MPELNASTVELTTGATDAILGILALFCIVYLQQYRGLDKWKVGIWGLIFATLFLAAILGAVVHGFELSGNTKTLMWRPLYFLLASLVALFVVAATYDWLGTRAARHILFLAAPVVVGFFLVTQFIDDSFRIFVIYELVSMLAALCIYVWLAAKGRLSGAGLIACSILLNIVAAGIQAGGQAQFTLIWSFDHNGVFHLVQIIAILVLIAGLRRSLQAP